MVVYGRGFTVSVHQNDDAVINRDRTLSAGQHGKNASPSGPWFGGDLRGLCCGSRCTEGSWFIYRVSINGGKDSTNPVSDQVTGEPHL